MNIILVEPGKDARLTTIGSTLKDMQDVVGGYIEAIYPYNDPIALVCNEESKLNNLEMNRVLRAEDGTPIDVICGTFFICGITEDNFGDIPKELAPKYLGKFLMAQRIVPSPYGGLLVTMYHSKEEKENGT